MFVAKIFRLVIINNSQIFEHALHSTNAQANNNEHNKSVLLKILDIGLLRIR